MVFDHRVGSGVTSVRGEATARCASGVLLTLGRRCVWRRFCRRDLVDATGFVGAAVVWILNQSRASGRSNAMRWFWLRRSRSCSAWLSLMSHTRPSYRRLLMVTPSWANIPSTNAMRCYSPTGKLLGVCSPVTMSTGPSCLGSVNCRVRSMESFGGA